MRPNLERLERACQIVEQRATERNFDLGVWGRISSCGFIGCFMGHVAISGEFPELAVTGRGFIRWRDPEPPCMTERTGMDAAAQFFNISYSDAHELFNPGFYVFHRDAKAVVDRVRRYIAAYKNEHGLDD